MNEFTKSIQEEVPGLSRIKIEYMECKSNKK